MSLFILLLTTQVFAALASLIGTLIVVSVVIFLFLSSATYEDKYAVKEKVYKARTRYFFGLSLVIVVAVLSSLQFLPYASSQSTADQTVTVVGVQWAWKMGLGETDKSAKEFAGTGEVTVPTNKVIKFVVTSADVNHNFAIYNSAGDLVAQTQAMPGYKNNLFYTFPKPGEYAILCLEYCGVAHGIMMGKIHVN